MECCNYFIRCVSKYSTLPQPCASPGVTCRCFCSVCVFGCMWCLEGGWTAGTGRWWKHDVCIVSLCAQHEQRRRVFRRRDRWGRMSNVSYCKLNMSVAQPSPIAAPLSSPGLESDDSCEVSFKDALVFDNKKVTDDGSSQENGVWERR